MQPGEGHRQGNTPQRVRIGRVCQAGMGRRAFFRNGAVKQKLVVAGMEKARQEKWAGPHPEPPRHTGPAWSHPVMSTPPQRLAGTTPVVWMLSPRVFLDRKLPRVQSCADPWWSDSQGQHRAITYDLQDVYQTNQDSHLALLSSSPCLPCPAYSSSCPEPTHSWERTWPRMKPSETAPGSLWPAVSPSLHPGWPEPFLAWALQQGRAGEACSPEGPASGCACTPIPQKA